MPVCFDAVAAWTASRSLRFDAALLTCRPFADDAPTYADSDGLSCSLSSRSYLYHITLPSPLAADESITLTTVAVLTGSSRALPASIQQGEEQFLLWRGDVGVKSIFDTDVARVKIR